MMTRPFNCLALLVALLTGSAVAAQQTPADSASPLNEAKIVFYKKKTDSGEYPIDCTIPFPASDKRIRFADNDEDIYGCTNDDDYAFKLENIPSAAIIELWENDDCDKQNDWVFKLKTIRHPTQMNEPLEIERLATFQPDSVVVPGVKLADKYRPDEDKIGGKLSCIYLLPSPLP